MPTELLASGVPTSVLQNTVYALPAGASAIESTVGLEISDNGTSWAALTKSASAKRFVRCASGNAIILVRSLSKAIQEYEVIGAPALTYQDTIKADGAIAYWPLDDPSGTVALDKVGTRHGTISGGVTLNQAGVNGSKCMVFDGTTGRIDAPTITIPTVFSIECWIKRVGLGAGYDPIWTNRTSGIPGNIFTTLYLGRPEFGGGGVTSASSTRLDDGTWHYLSITSTGTQMQMFIDGSSASINPLPITATTGLIRIGHDDFGGFAGTQLQDIAIYNRALTPAEIQSHYTKRLE